MSETREQWLKASRCAGCPHLRHDTPYFGNGPTFYCENHTQNTQQFFAESLHGVRQENGEILYRSPCPEVDKK